MHRAHGPRRRGPRRSDRDRAEARAEHSGRRHRDHGVHWRADARARRRGQHRHRRDDAGCASQRQQRRTEDAVHDPRRHSERFQRSHRGAGRRVRRRRLRRVRPGTAVRRLRSRPRRGAEGSTGHAVRSQRNGRSRALRLEPADALARGVCRHDLRFVRPGARRVRGQRALQRQRGGPARGVVPALRSGDRQRLPEPRPHARWHTEPVRQRRYARRGHVRRARPAAVRRGRGPIAAADRQLHAHRAELGAVSRAADGADLRRRWQPRRHDPWRRRGDARSHRAGRYADRPSAVVRRRI